MNWFKQGFSFLIQEGEEEGEMFDTGVHQGACESPRGAGGGIGLGCAGG